MDSVDIYRGFLGLVGRGNVVLIGGVVGRLGETVEETDTAGSCIHSSKVPGPV